MGGYNSIEARASRPFALNEKLTGGTPVPLGLQETDAPVWAY